MQDGTVECVDDALEHTILDRMMEEWVVEVDDNKDGGGDSLTEEVIMGGGKFP